MTEEELDGLGSALDDFLSPYLYCCGCTQTFGHLHTYCRGLLSDLKRKSAEPIALAAGCAVRTLQEFLKDHSWQYPQVRQLLQRHVGTALADVGSIAVHIGARASALADPSEMLVSSTVKDLVASSGWHLYRVAG